jgi:hypothetical protein
LRLKACNGLFSPDDLHPSANWHIAIKMTRSEELKRIQAAIQHQSESDLRWAEDYCRMRVKTAILSKHKSYWKGMQRGVDCALRRLSVTEGHISAQHWSSYNRLTFGKSELCGCFYCLEVFPSSEITDWTDNGDTALCPNCGIDSVIGSGSGYPIQREFLSKMHDHWF